MNKNLKFEKQIKFVNPEAVLIWDFEWFEIVHFSRFCVKTKFFKGLKFERAEICVFQKMLI